MRIHLKKRTKEGELIYLEAGEDGFTLRTEEGVLVDASTFYNDKEVTLHKNAFKKNKKYKAFAHNFKLKI